MKSHSVHRNSVWWIFIAKCCCTETFSTDAILGEAFEGKSIRRWCWVGIAHPASVCSFQNCFSSTRWKGGGKEDSEASRTIPLDNKSSKTIVLKGFFCLFVYPMEESEKIRLSCQDSKLESLDRLWKSKASTTFALCQKDFNITHNQLPVD